MREGRKRPVNYWSFPENSLGALSGGGPLLSSILVFPESSLEPLKPRFSHEHEFKVAWVFWNDEDLGVCSVTLAPKLRGFYSPRQVGNHAQVGAVP